MTAKTKEIIKKIKKEIVEVSAASREGHIPSAFSILDILWVLYDQIMNIDPKNPGKEDRDRLVVSKGHASLGLYSVLAEKGFFSKDELKKFGSRNSILGGHPDKNKIPGVEASTGSLGHGFPIALGMAMALKIKKNPARVFVIVGDGETNEGTIWESLLLANEHKLDNLYCIVDYNHSGDRALSLGNLEKKFKSFGWKTHSINGHDHKEIAQVFKKKNKGVPTAIIANTIKGYGCKIMENNPEWHHKFPTDNELQKILSALI